MVTYQIVKGQLFLTVKVRALALATRVARETTTDNFIPNLLGIKAEG